MSLFDGRPHALSAARRALLATDPSAVPWTRQEYRDRHRRACAAIARKEFAYLEEKLAGRAFRLTLGGGV